MVRRTNYNNLLKAFIDASTSDKQASRKKSNDLVLDNLGNVLVIALFNREIILPWSKAVKTAIITKLGFIEEKIENPDFRSPTFNQWQKSNCLVTSWILNSVIKEMAEAFLYVKNAKIVRCALVLDMGY